MDPRAVLHIDLPVYENYKFTNLISNVTLPETNEKICTTRATKASSNGILRGNLIVVTSHELAKI